MTHVSCPNCETRLSVREAAAGRPVTCPRCRRPCRVPESGSAGRAPPPEIAPELSGPGRLRPDHVALKTVGDYVADLGDRGEEVRNLARGVLVALGPAAVEAVPALTALLSESDGSARCRVVEALNRIKQPGC